MNEGREESSLRGEKTATEIEELSSIIRQHREQVLSEGREVETSPEVENCSVGREIGEKAVGRACPQYRRLSKLHFYQAD